MRDPKALLAKLKSEAITSLVLHGWSEPAAAQFVECFIGMAALHVAGLQSDALSTAQSEQTP